MTANGRWLLAQGHTLCPQLFGSCSVLQQYESACSMAGSEEPSGEFSSLLPNRVTSTSVAAATGQPGARTTSPEPVRVVCTFPVQLQPRTSRTQAPSEGPWRCHPDPNKRHDGCSVQFESIKVCRPECLDADPPIVHRRNTICATWLSTDPGNMDHSDLRA
jgi:hypothetical protein